MMKKNLIYQNSEKGDDVSLMFVCYYRELQTNCPKHKRYEKKYQYAKWDYTFFL